MYTELMWDLDILSKSSIGNRNSIIGNIKGKGILSVCFSAE